MRTINVQMSDFEYNALGLSKNTFFFSEIMGLIERQLNRNNGNVVAEIEEFSPYDEQFVAKIKSQENQQGVKLDIDNLWN